MNFTYILYIDVIPSYHLDLVPAILYILHITNTPALQSQTEVTSSNMARYRKNNASTDINRMKFLKVTKTKMMLSFVCDCNLRWGMALDDNSNNQDSLNSFLNPRKSEKKRS